MQETLVHLLVLWLRQLGAETLGALDVAGLVERLDGVACIYEHRARRVRAIMRSKGASLYEVSPRKFSLDVLPFVFDKVGFYISGTDWRQIFDGRDAPSKFVPVAST